jgi:hypothetical protein
MKKVEAKQIFEGRNGDDLYDAYGPSKLGKKIVWEGFVKDADKEWQARFILVEPDRSYEVYEDFQAFMLEVGDLYDGLESKRLRERMMVLMPAVALLVAIGMCAYLVVFKENYSAWAAAFMFFSIIASACVLYFGTYKQPKFPGTST